LIGSGWSADPSPLGFATAPDPRHLGQVSRPKLESGCNFGPNNLGSLFVNKPNAFRS